MVDRFIQYRANDGKLFNTEAEAVAHEKKIAYEKSPAGMRKKRIDNLLASYSISKLLGEYSLSSEGVWEIYGEDANADIGGSHYTPHLVTVSGTLMQAIEYAVDLKNFYTWGGGGEIRAAKPVKKL